MAHALQLSAVAQTNVALYRQMRFLGYGAESLRLARDSYSLVRGPFAGHYRACGKPFVCHLVGTASIIASLESDPELISAALLHSVYEPFFQFGNNRGSARLTPDVIRDAVGENVERYVAAYRDTPWTVTSIPALAKDAPSAGTHHSKVLLLRLTNELDDHLDHAMAYCAQGRSWNDATFDLWVDMAGALGYPTLAKALQEVHEDTHKSDWARPLGEGHRTSYSVLSDKAGFFSRLRTKLWDL
jgi:(p)ppGpp synthase/HD superfamily hydrolase